MALAAPNILINGDFESGAAGWTEWNSPQAWPTDVFGHNYASGGTIWIPAPYPLAGTGSHSQQVGTQAVHGGIFQVLGVVAGETYHVSGSWAGGVGGFTPAVPAAAWFEVVVYDGAITANEIDQAPGADDVLIAKREYPASEGSFDWRHFQGTFIAKSPQVTFALKAGKAGGDWDAIAVYHDNMAIRLLPQSVGIPTLSQLMLLVLACILAFTAARTIIGRGRTAR